MEGGSEGEEAQAQAQASEVGTPSGDDTAAAILANEAAALFRNKSYTECLNLLEQLLAKKENDPKVIHNVALAEFHRDGSKNPSKLLATLEQVKARCEELARAADEQLEGIGSNNANGNNVSAGYIEDYDLSIPSLNKAIVYYHLKQYASALALLEPLFANIEPVDENCALQICLLMLDITLASRRAEKVAAVLQYVEKSYGLGTEYTPPSMTAQTTLPPLEGKNQSLSAGISSSPAPPSLVNSPVSEGPVSSGEETFEEDARSIGLEIDGSRSKSLPTRLEKSPPAPGTDLKLLMHLYRVRFLLLTGGLKTAKREVKLALNLSKDNITALLMKAELEYSRGNYRKSLKLLTTCNGRGESLVEPLVLSNLGCVYHFLNKDETATLFFVKALGIYADSFKERPLKLITFSRDKSAEVSYNCGLVHLLSGKPYLAARSFQEAATSFYNKPLFWLRFAECCILALEKGLIQDVSASARREELKAVLIGQGKSRRLILPSGSMNCFKTGGPEEVPELLASIKAKKPVKLSMGLAKRCLQNALYILNSITGTDATDEIDDAVNKDVGTLEVFKREQKMEKDMTKLCVLTDLAFVELCLENPQTALKYAEEVLWQPCGTKTHSFLAHIYAAEALCLLDRLKEAVSHLGKCMMDWPSGIADVSIEEAKKGGEGEEEGRSLREQMEFAKYTGAQAKASLYVNMAAVHAMQGDVSQARQYALQAHAIAPGNSLTAMAMVYVELSQGRPKEALSFLKRFRCLSVTRLRPRD